MTLIKTSTTIGIIMMMMCILPFFRTTLIDLSDMAHKQLTIPLSLVLFVVGLAIAAGGMIGMIADMTDDSRYK